MSDVASYSTVDKSTWGEGPWQSEPDKVHFIDEVTDLDCLANRNRSDAWCGYVAVPPGHPWYELNENDSAPGPAPSLDGRPLDGYGTGGLIAVLAGKLDDFAETLAGRVEVHGGVTFSGFCADGGETSSICHVPRPGYPARVWWIGFDCAHWLDLAPGARDRVVGITAPDPDETYRTLDYVRAECSRLAAQAALAGEPA